MKPFQSEAHEKTSVSVSHELSGSGLQSGGFNVRRTAVARPLRANAVALAVAFALAGPPGLTHAASLGQLQVLSAAGQPLVAEIEVDGLVAGDLATLKAGVADAAAFRAAQLEPSALLSRLRFEVVRGLTDERAVIRITSSEPLNARSLDALIELNWSGGRVVREYTLPTARPVAPDITPVEAPVISPVTATAPAEAVSDAGAKVSVDVSRAPTGGGGVTPNQGAAQRMADAAARTVRRGDSLGQIAREVAPDPKAVNAAMAAIFASNRSAFIGNSIHLLREGAVLNIPDEAELTRRSNRAALQMLAEFDNRAADAFFQQIASTPATVKAPRGGDDASSGSIGRVQPERAPAKAEDQLKVSRSGKDEKSSEAQANARAEELLIKEKALQEANDRIAALEKNIADMQRLLEMKSAAGKTDVAASAPEKPGEKPGEKAGEKPADKPAEAVAADGDRPAESGETALKPEILPADAEKDKPEVELVEDPEAEEAKKPKPWYKNGLILAAAGGAVVLGGGAAGFLYFRRRRQALAETAAPAAPVADLLADPTADLLNADVPDGPDASSVPADADLAGFDSGAASESPLAPDADADLAAQGAGALADVADDAPAGELAGEAAELASAVDLEFGAEADASAGGGSLLPPEMSAGDPPRPGGSFADELDAMSAQVGEASESLNALKDEAAQSGALDDDFGGLGDLPEPEEEQARVPGARLSDTLASIDLNLPGAGDALPADPLAEPVDSGAGEFADLAAFGDAAGDSSTDAASAPGKEDLARWQEMETKLDLAAAYIEIGDSESARDLLGEVARKGDDTQQGRASELLARAG